MVRRALTSTAFTIFNHGLWHLGVVDRGLWKSILSHAYHNGNNCSIVPEPTYYLAFSNLEGSFLQFGIFSFLRSLNEV